ncbi:beta-D-glucosyl crocetin beta-1,6-glucosyltransferase-like [Camellia sinensis]|uniref:beta-D-glucosyl crocetin beta-1,6-glucosyltransferase-like n=1 Tax=Camellia sinensis TaxID=4442 RepID=UPI0010357135|nr:beta-D-glucosyl crocetin beta-1,6-glucosyltransferase-like [Camellia sinensis]
MNTKQSTISVLMLPWLAHGHISPFLELAKKLSHRNFHIYLCSTPINLKSIKNRITERYSHSIELVEIHLPSLPELPPHYHTTNGLPTHLNSALHTAFEMASPSFFTILDTLTPDLVIHDFTPSWPPTIASSFNIPAVQLMTSSPRFHETRFHHTIENATKKSKDKQAAPVNDQLFFSFKISMPMHLDQPLNARLVEEVGVAMEVIRDENGRRNREAIAQVIRKIVVEKSGEDKRIKARELSEKIRMKGEEEIDEVIKELFQLCKDR